MEDYQKKLIRHKRRQRDKLVDILIWLSAAILVAVGYIFVLLLYCRMAGPLIWEVM